MCMYMYMYMYMYICAYILVRARLAQWQHALQRLGHQLQLIFVCVCVCVCSCLAVRAHATSGASYVLYFLIFLKASLKGLY